VEKSLTSPASISNGGLPKSKVLRFWGAVDFHMQHTKLVSDKKNALFKRSCHHFWHRSERIKTTARSKQSNLTRDSAPGFSVSHALLCRNWGSEGVHKNSKSDSHTHSGPISSAA